MAKGFIVSGTDTGIGKTSVAAMLTLALGMRYWKPLQSGTDDGTDTKRVRAMLASLPDERFLPERYVLSQPLSPHRAAELDGVEIDAGNLDLPETDDGIIVEGAGGLLVPVTRDKLQIDVFAQWKLPVILCARTGLGTINHSLLSIEALLRRNIALHGLIFMGADNADNMRTIADFSGVAVLGHMPLLDVIDEISLARVFAERFRKDDFI